MIQLHTQEAEQLREGEMAHAFGFALAFGILTILAVLVSIGVSMAFFPDLLQLLVVTVFGVGGATIMLVLILGFRRGRQHMSDIVETWRQWMLQEMARRKKETASVTTIRVLPQATQEVIPVTRPPKAPELVQGFDMRDIESLCIAFSLGARWSEAALMDKPLPVTKMELGKTLYYKLIDEVFIPAGVIGGRGGPGNKTGKLEITDPDAMMAAIRAKFPTALSNQG